MGSLHDHCEVMEAIKASIVARYNGDLERHINYDDRDYYYTPLDTDHIRHLLINHFGDALSGAAIEEVFDALDGAEKWPRAFCEEDFEEEHERLGGELDQATDALDELRKRR